jgi:outer membrane protein TolC
MGRILIFLFLLLSASLYAFDNAESYLTFSRAADLAVSYSADLRFARSSQALKEKIWMWGLRSYFPRISFSASENDRLQGLGADSFVKNYGISVDQLIWDGGKTSLSRKLEQMDLVLSSSALDKTALEIQEQTLSAYRKILLSRAILEIRDAAFNVLKEQRRILNEEVLLGLALPVDLASADISLSEAKLNIISLKIDLGESERQFAELLGLENLPELTEKININRSAVLPLPAAAEALARERNPDLIEAQFSITKKQIELKYVSNSWIPGIRLAGNFGVTGQHYPLTRCNWSVGINVDFSNPWFQNRVGIQAGFEPPYDKSASVQNSFTPLPEPASGYGKKQAMLALALEHEKYAVVQERIGRIAANAVEKCLLAEQKRLLTIEAASIGSERCRIEELRLELGQITRLTLMETLIEQTQREIAVVEAAVALLEAERELEKFLDLHPGELAVFAASLFETAFFEPITFEIEEKLSFRRNL